LKRAAQGRLDYFGFIEKTKQEIAAGNVVASLEEGALSADVAACEQAKRLVAFSVDLLVSKNLQDLVTKQQHLEVLANMIIDTFAAASVVARTRKFVQTHPDADAENELDLTRIFVASANERIADGARRLVANELQGDEMLAAFGTIDALATFMPIATIAAKTRIAERIAAGNLRFLDQ